MSLKFLADGWDNAFIEFQALSVGDVKEKFATFTQVDTTNPQAVAGQMDRLLELLQSKFLRGQAVDDKGQLVDLVKEDLKDLPVEFISEAIGFLSRSLGKSLPKQLEIASTAKEPSNPPQE